MNPYQELVGTLKKSTRLVGEVVGVTGTTIRVRGPHGVVVVNNFGNLVVSQGDTVTVSNGVLLGKTKPESTVPVFHI